MFLRGWRRRLLEALITAENRDQGLTQIELSRRLEVSQPTISQHVRVLREEELLSRPPRVELGHGATLRAPCTFGAFYIDRRRGIIDEWSAPIPAEYNDQLPIDLRFPFVTRVRDPKARMFLHEWLDRALSKGLLPPHVSLFEPPRQPTSTLTIGVYGSCVRGTAHDKSDLDLVLYADPDRSSLDKLEEFAHKVLIESQYASEYRPLDVLKIQGQKSFKQMDSGFISRLQDEIKTIYTTDQKKPFLEQMVRSG